MEKSVYENNDGLNLKATELRLGLPGIDESEQPPRNNKRSFSSSQKDEVEESTTNTNTTTPPPKAQVVGWPPVRSYRKNALKKPESDGFGILVKVSMDGAPYLRKIDLKSYNNYSDLLKALESMFKCTIVREGCNGSEFKPTYEDKDGDWMLVGDVPWEMFITSCKRLRIMKGSE